MRNGLIVIGMFAFGVFLQLAGLYGKDSHDTEVKKQGLLTRGTIWMVASILYSTVAR